MNEEQNQNLNSELQEAEAPNAAEPETVESETAVQEETIEVETDAVQTAEEPAVQEAPEEKPQEPAIVYRWDYAAQKRHDDALNRKKQGKRSVLAFTGIVATAFLLVIGLLIGVLVFRDNFTPIQYGMDTADLAEKLMPSNVLISATKGTTGSSGSGFFIRESGYIVTNYHVVEGTTTIKVKTYQSTEKLEATLIGYNEECDLAVLKVPGSGYPAVKFGNSDSLRAGETVVVVGNPDGSYGEWSITEGIVSAVDRKLTDSGSTEFLELRMIQVDAAANPGNSGGMVCNQMGEVIGIIARKQIYESISTATGVATIFHEGMSFAIPSSGAKTIVDSLIRTGTSDGIAAGLLRKRPKIGIAVQSIQKGEKPLDKQPRESPVDGVIVVEVTSDSAKEVLAAGDIIVEFDGKPVTDSDQMIEMMYSYKQGDKVRVKVYKSEDSYWFWITVELTLGVSG